jgi:hypothetical protein
MDSQDTQQSTAVFAQLEYRSLRETIQTRGSLRFTIAAATFFVWAALSLWCWTSSAGFIAGLVPLVVLIAGFEVVLAIHTGVERIGRYVQLTFENGGPTPPAWEHIAVAMGPRWLSPWGLDALFSVTFVAAVFFNFVLVGAAADSTRTTVLASVTHLSALVRILQARRFAAMQRKIDFAALESVISSNALVSRIQQRR